MSNNNGNGRKDFWLKILLPLAAIFFGAGGTAYVTRDAIARHDVAIRDLTERATATEVDRAKLATKLDSIDCRLANIERLLSTRL